MATKDKYQLLFKDKQNDVTINGQYSNFALNKNYPVSSNAPSENSKNSILERRNVLDYGEEGTAASTKLSDFTNDVSQTKKESNSWKNNSTKNLSPFIKNNGSGKEEDGLKKGKALNASTLTLHIEAYEKSNDANLFEKEGLKKNDLIKNGLNTKQINFDSTAVIQKPFEFPRQQENDEAVNPEVSQYRASQRLLNPNQINQTNPGRASIPSKMPISLCSSCYTAISDNLDDTEEAKEFYQCCLCFGLLDPLIYAKIIEKTKEEYIKNGYDGKQFVLAVNFPVSQLFRELFIQKIMDKKWNEMMMSPKSRLTYNLMAKFRQDGFLRPSLAGDLTATVTFENTEFVQRDTEFFLCHKPAGFLNAGNRKRKTVDDEEINGLFTKVKVQNLVDQLSLDVIKAFSFTSPSKPLDITVGFQRDVLYIGGRYCKFSRSLPQSPWTINHETPKIPGNSVAEKVSNPLQEYFRCDSTKFIASGREDIDVRMLGKGRPFAVVLQNARKWVEMYSTETREKALKMLKEKINAANKDIKVGDLAVVDSKETQLLNVGQEDKKKIYTALCYSHEQVTEEMGRKLEAAMPVEINQLTPIRVLFRRPLLDRPRTIHAAKIQILDDHYFYLNVETQAGTYVKEFVHSDFGRTRPSVGTLLGLELTDGLSILELDVEGVDLEWPPSKKEHKNGF